MTFDSTEGVLTINTRNAEGARQFGKILLAIASVCLFAAFFEPVVHWALGLFIFFLFALGAAMITYQQQVVITSEKLVDRRYQWFRHKEKVLEFSDVDRICIGFDIARGTAPTIKSKYFIFPILVIKKSAFSRHGEEFNLLGILTYKNFNTRPEFYDFMVVLSELTGLDVFAEKNCPPEIIERFGKDRWR